MNEEVDDFKSESISSHNEEVKSAAADDEKQLETFGNMVKVRQEEASPGRPTVRFQ